MAAATAIPAPVRESWSRPSWAKAEMMVIMAWAVAPPSSVSVSVVMPSRSKLYG